MKKIYQNLLLLALGLAIGGIYVQYRMTGHIWSNRPIMPIEKWEAIEDCWNKDGIIYASQYSRKVVCEIESRTEIYSSYKNSNWLR